MQSVKIDKYTFYPSTRKDKKLMVSFFDNDNIYRNIHFGAKNMQHYYDKTGLFPQLNHYDEDRRKRYLARATNIKNKKGELTYNNENSPNYFSINFLW